MIPVFRRRTGFMVVGCVYYRGLCRDSGGGCGIAKFFIAPVLLYKYRDQSEEDPQARCAHAIHPHRLFMPFFTRFSIHSDYFLYCFQLQVEPFFERQNISFDLIPEFGQLLSVSFFMPIQSFSKFPEPHFHDLKPMVHLLEPFIDILPHGLQCLPDFLRNEVLQRLYKPPSFFFLHAQPFERVLNGMEPIVLFCRLFVDRCIFGFHFQ